MDAFRFLAQRRAVSALYLSSLDALVGFEHDRYARIDGTIQQLREQLPLLLTRPLDKRSATEIYSNTFVLLGPSNEELALGLDELIALSTTIVTAASATRQASRLAQSLTPSSQSPTTDNSVGWDTDLMLVASKMILDISQLDTLQVKWEVRLLPSSTSTIAGLSQINLDPNGLISKHKLLNLKVNDQPVNAVGEALATLRRAIKSVQESPWISLATSSFPMLSEIRDELLQQATAVAVATDSRDSLSIELPPLFAVTSLVTTNFANDVDPTNNSTVIPIDDFDWPSPLPGSRSWKEYESSYQSLTNFVERDIPILSSGSPKDALIALFSPNCTWIAMDGKSIVCTGGEAVADFFRILASIRQGALPVVQPLFGGSTWSVTPIHVDWRDRSVVVQYVANNPVRIEGTDRYRLSKNGRVDTIEQIELIVQGTKVEDPEWFRQFYQSIQTGRRSAFGSDAILDLLDQLGLGQKMSDHKTFVGPLNLPDAAAASFYRVLCALHQDFSSLPTTLTASSLTSSTTVQVPAAAFLAPSIELRGYLNEVLLRGEKSYRAATSVAITSLRTILLSERVVLEMPPTPTIIFQSDGTIRVDLVLKLRLPPIVIVGSGTRSDIGGGGFVLKLEFKSVYRVNEEGKIVEHKIVETRVNDQLTPGDVVVRFWKGISAGGGNSNVAPSTWRSVLDALNWARSVASSNN